MKTQAELQYEEKCVRCGIEGEGDLRTLWHSCLYRMSELDVPFKESVLRGVHLQKTGTKVIDICGSGMTINTFEEPSEEEKPFDLQMYTLKVCKDCRAGWLHAIEAWFHGDSSNDTVGGVPSEARNIPVRRNGAITYVNEKEYAALYPGRTPLKLA